MINLHERVLHTPVCCIYHKPRRFDESSSEEESDSESESECRHHHDHSSHAPSSGGGSSSSGAHQTRDGPSLVSISHDDKSEPNAYEKQPPSKGKRKTGWCYISDLLKNLLRDFLPA